MSFFNLLKHRKNSEAGSFIGVTENERALLLRCSFFITADTSVTWDAKQKDIFFMMPLMKQSHQKCHCIVCNKPTTACLTSVNISTSRTFLVV